MLAILIAIAFVFTALGIVCAVWIGRSRPPAADPFSHPFGDIAFIDSARPVSRADQGSGGNGKSSQGAAAARPIEWRNCRAR